MSVEFIATETYSFDDNHIIKIDCIYVPKCEIIEPLHNDKNIKLAIITPLTMINQIRSNTKNFKSQYDELKFFTPDGTLIRVVPKDGIIGDQGTIEGYNVSSFSDIVLPENVDHLIIILDQHYSVNFVSKKLISRELIKDIEKLKNNCSKLIQNNTKITFIVENNINKFLAENKTTKKEFFYTDLEDAFDNTSVKIEYCPNNTDYILKKICENYFGVQKSIYSKGIITELKVNGVIYYTLSNKSDKTINIGFIETRNIISLKFTSSEYKEYTFFIFLKNNNTKIEYKNSELKIIKTQKLYNYLNDNELKKIYDLIINIKSNINKFDKKNAIQNFNISLYEFGDCPLINTLNLGEMEIHDEITSFIYYFHNLINEFKNENQFKNIFIKKNKKDKNNIFNGFNDDFDDKFGNNMNVLCSAVPFHF
jgi:hypothetical protein